MWIYSANNGLELCLLEVFVYLKCVLLNGATPQRWYMPIQEQQPEFSSENFVSYIPILPSHDEMSTLNTFVIN